MRIEVKQEHIDKGIRAKCTTCPVALAIHEATSGELGTVYVDVTTVFVGSMTSIPLPIVAIEWIAEFDYQGTGEPFSFELDLEAARVD
jgi:hypothetical protein